MAKVKAGIKLELKAKQMNIFLYIFFLGRNPRGMHFSAGDESHIRRTYSQNTHTLVFNQMRIHTYLSEHLGACVWCVCASEFLSYLHLFHFAQTLC